MRITLWSAALLALAFLTLLTTLESLQLTLHTARLLYRLSLRQLLTVSTECLASLFRLLPLRLALLDLTDRALDLSTALVQ